MYLAKKESHCELCPACHQTNLKVIDRTKFRDFDDSIFNIEVEFGFCQRCNFVRVLVPFTDSQIVEYYSKQSLYSSLTGVGAGGSAPEDIERYQHYINMLDGIIDKSSSIVDIGCSNGGFLKFLRHKAAYKGELTGIDLDAQSLSTINDSDIDTVQGSALDLNLSQDSFDLAFYTHILEHIIDFDSVIVEMKRIIVNGGYVLIEVPDALKYSETRVYDFCWTDGMKEHVNHFTPESLRKILQRHGLEIQAMVRKKFTMKGGYYYPSLIVLVKLTNHPAKKFALEKYTSRNWLEQYLQRERYFAAKTKHNLETFISSQGEPAIWGIGHEFFNLLALNILQINKDFILIDSNTTKQQKLASGCKILDPKNISKKEALVCTSSMNWQQIVQHACDLGFDNRKIYCIY